MTLKFTRKIRLDRMGSGTLPARLNNIVEVSPDVVAAEGSVVVVRALEDRKVYGEIELPSGRMSKIVAGNLIAGVLGARQALHGFMGDVPKTLAVGDTIHMLNIGGVMGTYSSGNKAVGTPIPLEVIGNVVRNGQPVNIKDYALPPCDQLKAEGPPLLIIMGTCMNSGKTSVAAETIRLLSHSGVRIAAGKLSGVAALKDILSMEDNGAIATSSFLHCGLPSTVITEDLAPMARSVIAHLETSEPQVIVLELGDGIIGGYHVDSILRDDSIRRRTKARVLCANDLVGAWGGIEFLKDLDHVPEVVSGPVTDNKVGTSYISRELKTACANVKNEPVELARLIASFLGFPTESIK